MLSHVWAGIRRAPVPLVAALLLYGASMAAEPLLHVTVDAAAAMAGADVPGGEAPRNNDTAVPDHDCAACSSQRQYALHREQPGACCMLVLQSVSHETVTTPAVRRAPGPSRSRSPPFS
jgi:hypothetical protein